MPDAIPAPNLVEIDYDDVALTVTAVWQPLPPYVEFAVVLLQGGAEFAKGKGFGGNGSVKLTAALPVGTGAYEVAVAAIDESGTQGPFSNQMKVITGRLSGLTATTEPPRIEAAWTLPKGSELTNGAQLTLLGPSGTVARESLLGSAGALALPGALEPGVAYKLRARPLFGQSFGPYVDLSLATAPARIAEMTYEPGTKPQITVALLPPVPEPCLAGADLFADGVLVKTVKGENGALVEIPLGAALEPAVAWEVRPFWWAGEARGPSGPAAPVIVDGAAVRQVTVSPSTVAVSWSTYPGPPYPSGAAVTVTPVAGGEPARIAYFLGVTEGSFEPKPPLVAGTPYELTVAGLREPSFGPPGAAVPVIAAKPPAPSTARYDGTRLTAGWQATAPPGATGCTMVVLQGGSVIAGIDLPAAASSGVIEVALGPAVAPYSVALQWTAERSRGPLSGTTAVIAAVPGVAAIAVTDTKVEVTVEPPASTVAIGSYEAALFREGEQLASTRVAAGAGKPVAAIPYATEGGAGYEVRVTAASGIDTVQQSTGPESAAVPVPAAPRVTSAVVAGNQLALAWEPAARPRVASTTVVVTPSSGEAVTFPGLPGTSATLTLPAGLLLPGLTLTLRASCATALGTTPPSAALTLLTATPELKAASFDGERVSATWEWPKDAPDAAIATAYRLTLRVGGVAVRSVICSGLGGTLDPGMALGPTAAAELRVDALAGPAEALAGAGTALVVAPPRLLAAAVEGGKVTLTFAGVTTPGECAAVFSSPGEEDKVVAKVGTSPAVVTIPTLAADPLVPLAVALATQNGIAEGPRSEALPILRATVAPRLATADAGVLTVEWDEVPGGPTAYLATLYAAGVAERTASVRQPPARLDASGAKPATAYTVGVVARAGGASGPAATPLPALLAGATLAKPSFDGTTLSAAVTPPSGTGATLSGYELALLRNGEAVQTAELEVPGDGVLRLTVDSPVDPRAAYRLAVRPLAGVAVGPTAGAGALLVPPSLDSLAWAAGTLTVTGSAGDLPSEGLTLYATLFQAGQNPQTKPLVEGSAAFSAPAGSTYEVSVHGETAAAVGPPSARLTALTEAPTIASAEFAAGRVTAVWSAVPAAEYAVAITDASGKTVAAATVGGLGAWFDLMVADGGAYKLAITARNGPVVGPTSTLPLVTAACPATAACHADGRTVSLAWSLEAGGGPTPTGFVPVLRWEGAELELEAQPAGTTSAEITLPEAVPAGAAIGVKAVSGAASGPLANLAPVLAGAPEDFSLAYAGGRLRASWKPPADARVTGALVALKAGGVEKVIPVAGSSWSAAVAADSAAAVTVSVTAGDGTGPALGPVAAILAAPTIEECRFDGSVLEVTWPAGPAGASAWRVVARHLDQVVAEATVEKAEVRLPLPTQSLPFVEIGDLTVTIAALAPGVEGPESAPFDALVVAPRVTAAVTDGLTGVTTVSWNAVPTMPTPTYAVCRYVDGALVEKTGTAATSASLPALEPERDWEVAIEVLAPAGSIEGPPGPRFRVPTETPAVESVSFDGATATVRWSGVAGASGYAIDVFGGSPATSIGSAEVGAGAREARVTVTAKDRQAGRQVSVRAQFGPSSGPRALAPLFTPGIYLGAGEPPRLLRAGTEVLAAEAQVAYLPPMGLDPSKLPLKPPQPGPGTIPFELAANTDAATAEAFPYKLTIANGALVFDATRATLRETFLTLLTEAETKAGAKPWGLFAIGAAVARLMPQTFEETLLYAYGLNLEAGCVDLSPGMVLRVAFSEFDATPSSAATGYAGGAVVDYEVGDYFGGSEWLVGFDSFLAWLAGNSVIEVPAPVPGTAPPGPDFTESGGAEAADLFFPGFRTAFHRLFVPADLLSPNAAASARTKDQFSLVAATKFADLQEAGTAPIPTKTSVAYFRGRTVVKPSLRITVDGEQRVVPIGTTVGNVLDGLGRRAPSTKAALRGVSLERSPGPVVLDPTRGYDAAGEPVALDWEGLRTFGAPRGTLSLPLLHGDRLTVGG